VNYTYLMSHHSKRVVVAMSGGVDSSVTAALLQDQGFKVIGVTMQLLERSYEWGGCCGIGGIEDAKRVAHHLGIPHYVVNFREQFQEKVIADFCAEYQRGRTPNPCIRCNQYLKFADLLHKADELGAVYLATGHYARIAFDEPRQPYVLKKGLDPRKDQSYFLYIMTQAQLARTLMPVGALIKLQVRQIAEEKGLPVAHKPDSQEICFIPADDYRAFLQAAIPDAIHPGSILDTQGNVIGQHQGLPFYTIGQRKGMGISADRPLYVIAIDPQRNVIIAGDKEETYTTELVATQVNWIAFEQLSHPIQAAVRIRYQHHAAAALLTPLDKARVQVTFTVPQMAITPGQAVVFFDDETVLGGGVIA